ncbi:alpha-tocopherol transfer protein-like [Euwallacea fornicatus]|uniref:alpha-tocopherol transfer protein-like n=1 Tax=Euwallacea fornicatus TaxID=995702 RepID=UPI00338FF0E0
MTSLEKSGYLNIIKEWLSKQQHLPQNIHDKLLNRFLHSCRYSPEQAKTLIDLFYTLRSQAPEIFANRDPTSPELQSAFEHFDYIPMPKLGEANERIFIYRMNSSDVAKYDYVNSIKAFFILADIRMIVEETIPEGEIPIYDTSNFTLKHLSKVNLQVQKKFFFYSQEAHPINLKSIHVVNVPTFLDKCMQLMRPFMKPEVKKMIHTHVGKYTTLHEYIAPDLLPVEYGGTVGTVSDIKKWWMGKIMEHKDYLMDESRWAVDESKRTNDNYSRRTLGMEGSFRSLDID